MLDIRLIPVCDQLTTSQNRERVVVVDSLRATSTIVTALYNGCRAIWPAGDLQGALALKRQLQKRSSSGSILLGGEKNGSKPQGFDLGNSPREYTPGRVKGKIIILTTTNGTKALLKAQNAGEIIIGAWLNSNRVSEYLVAEAGPVSFLCAGTRGGFSLEDFFTCGKIITSICNLAAGKKLSINLDDGARTARLLYQAYYWHPRRVFLTSSNGLRLQETGQIADIDCCLQSDRLEIIPTFSRGRVLCHSRT